MTIHDVLFLSIGAVGISAGIAIKDHQLRKFHRQCPCGSCNVKRIYQLGELPLPEGNKHHYAYVYGKCLDCGLVRLIKFEHKRFLPVELWWRRQFYAGQFVGLTKLIERARLYIVNLPPSPRIKKPRSNRPDSLNGRPVGDYFEPGQSI